MHRERGLVDEVNASNGERFGTYFWNAMSEDDVANPVLVHSLLAMGCSILGG